ncbi:hypothetical protein WR25_02800 [Diploscapter pachys]|uniref:Uncharacterized protein n=1 Tax=Diploscapter pachys TaxID=2018661 RepID=A0A2A2LYN1_9BILA|nr:hypothetical protein WR25_02800 [Diploscapter pachys]
MSDVGAFGFGVGWRVGGKSGKSGTGRVGVDRVGRGGGDAERMGLMQQPQQEARITNRAKKKFKPRQEISTCLKYTVFSFNFIVFLIGVAILALGVYLFVKDFREVKLVDVILNPAIFLSVLGITICIISMLGSLGALRDNIFLLKSFALCVFLCYILVVVATFLLFILFYADTSEGISAYSLLIYAIKNYHTNRNLADIVDSMQENLQCCGVSSARDWNLSYTFNCTATNPQPEKCGVPYSCCKKSVISEAAGSSNPLLPAMRSLECWQGALTKRPEDLERDVYTRGCLQPLKSVFESHAVHIGAAVALIIVPVCLSVCLTNILAKQIDHQHYLLEREARRNERRQKKERHQRKRDRSDMRAAEEGQATNPIIKPPPAQAQWPKPPPPDIPVPPLPNAQKAQPVPGKVRTQSASPTRVLPRQSSTESAPKQRRKRSAGPPPLVPVQTHPNPPRPTHPPVSSPQQMVGSAHARTQQWVLQQSDLVQKQQQQQQQMQQQNKTNQAHDKQQQSSKPDTANKKEKS